MSVIHDIYELLLQRAALEDRLGDANTMFHQVVRKSSRSPSLRLRFGRRADPSVDVVDGGHPHPSAAESKGQWPDQRVFP
ncbi:hypothetical protein J437_LFUL001191 [Ladona fulva]|uniref:Uncharacterized protein n=1 Tax=Ladona fulva TaxID=123851 RepID=A0A8K0JWR9_LADFU|nr:hypothetical protein J437_LFUL001191 [Ladona fulva]